MIRRAAAVLLLALGLVLAPATAHAAPADDLAALATQARWANGLNGLLRNAAMDAVAANWANQLAASGTLAHNPNYAAEIPGGWVAAAENVAQGHPSASAMHDGWMSSPGHRANLLGDYTDIGVAFLSAGGTTWGVQVFAKYPGHVGPAPPAPPAPAPVEPAPAPAEPAPAPAEPAPEATPTATPSPTRSETPSARPSTAARDDTRGDDTRGDAARGEASVPWWPFAVGAALVAGASAFVVRQRLRR